MGHALLHFPLVLMNRLNKTESGVFSNCRFSLCLKDPFFSRLFTVNSEIFARVYFRETLENGKITLSFTDIGKSCISREV